MPDRDEATALALQYSSVNESEALFVNSVVAGDVKFGEWDKENQVFEEQATGGSAIQVTASLSEAKDNALPAFLGSFLGYEVYNLSEFAIAGATSWPTSAISGARSC